MNLFCGITADEVWRQAYQAMMAKETDKRQHSRSGDTHELLHVVLEIDDPRQRWVASRSPAINPAFGIAEVLWILAGSNDAAVLNYWFPGLPDFKGKGPTYEGAYGYRLRRQFGFDQIRRACDVLAANPSSRQAVLQLWDARADMPYDDGAPRCDDVPCNVLSLLKVRDEHLEWTQIMRSNDLHRGLPYNILQFTFLQEVMAGWLGLEVGSYHHWSDSLHIYVDDAALFSLTSEPPEAENTDSLALNANYSEALIHELFDRTRELTMPDVNETRIEEIISIPEAPGGYQNLLRVLGAESARRRGRPDQAQTIMARCANPQLVRAWSAWWERMQRAVRSREVASHS